MNFYTWVNFWYSTLEMIKIFSNKYKVRIKKQINSLKDLEVDDLVTTKKDEKKSKKKVNNIDINVKSKEESTEKNSLYDIIQLLKYSSDLNELINKINSYSEEYEFDKDNLSIRINSFNFDKFKEKKDYDNFDMTIIYSLADN